MVTPRVLRFDAEADPAPLAADPTPTDSDRYARERADVTARKSRDAAACIALSSLLPESEETHFTQVCMASEFLTAIKAHYTTPTTVSLGRLFLPFLFPDLTSFERTADLITHLRSLDSSYRATCTDAQLALLPPPMAITIYFIATSLSDRLASVRDALLLKHPSELTIEVLDSALKDVESKPPLGSLCLRRGGQGAGRGGGGGGGDVASGGGGSAGAGGAPRAAAGDSPTATGGGDAQVHEPPTGLPAARALADPTSGPVTARYTTMLPCPAVPSGSLIGFHVPLFSRNLVGVRPLVSQHVGVWIEPSGNTLVCVDGDTYAPLATFTAEPGSGLYTLHTGPQGQQQQQQLLPSTPVTVPLQVLASHQVVLSPQVTVSGQVPVSGPFAALCSCRSLAYPTVLWHHRMGHPSISRLCAMSSQRLVLGLPRVLSSLPSLLAPPCTPCVEGRLRATPHSSSLHPATEPFETLHLDVWGPASCPGPERESFFLVVVNDYSCYTTVFPMAKKSDVTSTLIRWLLTTPDTRGRHGIRQSWTLPESPQQNGVAERRIGLVMEIARTSMTHAHAPHILWPYAVRYAAHQLNLWPRVSRPEVSPTSLWTGSPGAASRFRVWGYLAIVQPPSLQSSSQPTADPSGAGFRGEDPGGASSRGVGVGAESVPVRGPDSGGAGVGAEPVTAGDSSLRGAGVSGAVPGSATTGGEPSARPGEPGTDPVTSGGAGSGGGATSSLENGPGATTAPDTTPFPHPYPTRHQARVRRAREEQLDLEREERELEWQQLELQWLEEQQQQPEQEQPQQHLVAAPPTSPLAVGGESALGRDTLEDRQFELEFLATASPHLCAMLLAPEEDPDALDIPTPCTYAEAVSGPWASQWRAAMDSEMASYRSTGTYIDEVPPPPWGERSQWHVDLQAHRDYELHSLDFSSSFLHGSLHEVVWLRRPSAFTGTFPPGTQWRLKRPVCSLRQAPCEWHDTLRSTLSDLGFQPSSANPSLFVRRGSTPFFVLFDVNDLVFATADRAALADVKLELQKRHTCTDLGELRHYLGLQITGDRAARTITRTPLAVDHRLTGLFPVEPFEPIGPYAELVGCLMYLMNCTRPDLTFPLSILARFVVPGRHRPFHWTAAVRVAKYLATTSGVGLVLGGRQDIVLTGHCDSSYADDAETHRSTQGYCFSLGSRAVSWRSTHSSLVSTSTAEAEIYAEAMAVQELRWLAFLLTDLSEQPSSASTLFTDNKAMILLC
ncbi:unnamed protein product [Closterium sp. NIES-53]